MSKPIRLAIATNQVADAQAFVRRLSAALTRRVEAETITSLVALRARLRAAGLPPLVLVDSALYGLEPVDGFADLHLDRPEARLIAIASEIDPTLEAETARAGARAVLAWRGCARHAARVIEIVAAGSSYMSTAALLAIGDGAARSARAQPQPPGMAPSLTGQLTDLENCILTHIRLGETNRRIGDFIGVDENRVKIHLRAIFKKIGARNRTEAALKASLLLPAMRPIAATLPVSVAVPIPVPVQSVAGELRAIA